MDDEQNLELKTSKTDGGKSDIINRAETISSDKLKSDERVLDDLSNEMNINKEINLKNEPDKAVEGTPGASNLSLFEKLRLKNIEENEKFLKEIDLTATSSVLAPPVQKKVIKSVPRRQEKLVYTNEPRRESARLKNRPAQANYVESDLTTNMYVTEPKVERIIPRVVFNGSLGTLGDESGNFELLKECLLSVTVKNEKRQLSQPSTEDEILTSLKKMTIRDADVAKCCQSRIYDAKFHPGSSKLLLATGDKYGNLGFWDVDAAESASHKSGGCYLRQPHSMPIRCLKFSPIDFSKLYTCSFDGTLKCVDMSHCEFSTVCKEDDLKFAPKGNAYRNGFHWFDFLQDGVTLCIGEELGHIVIADPRQPETSATTLVNGTKPVKCVSSHPTKPYILTSDYLGVKIWDIRSAKKKLIAELHHGKVTHGAFFSPITGDKILTTCADDFIRVFDSSVLDRESIKNTLKMRHDNHTGRWLAPFQAIWHPRNENIFVVGSMEAARKVEVFTTENVTGRPTFQMIGNDSICCRNTFHPSLDVFAGTTSSGKAFIWR